MMLLCVVWVVFVFVMSVPNLVLIDSFVLGLDILRALNVRVA
jgi:hypothetical protein